MIRWIKKTTNHELLKSDNKFVYLTKKYCEDKNGHTSPNPTGTDLVRLED
jgi:hypothetical protein